MKHKAEGLVYRYKTRLVTKRYTQTYGIDCERLFLALATHFGWDLYWLDVKNIFLHGVSEEVYMEIPSGFETYLGRNKVCLLKKVLYDLKQFP